MERPRIYQLLPRLFGNTNETRKPNGTIAENGCGKFADISDAALCSLRDQLHITHIWLTGVHAQATATDYSEIGAPADDPDLLKGLAGSPYAIKDYAFVCPDYAVEPARRMDEFRALLDRTHAHGLRVIIDFVPNHVARSHRSKLISFGEHDDRGRFFSPDNNFFWLQRDSPGGGPPLRLPTVVDGRAASPTCRVLGTCDGFFPAESETARVTGNNAATWAPSEHDWYETVKLNYGYDFTTGARAFPRAENPGAPVPDTWLKMNAVLARWQSLGVDGFRCDMAHMVPVEFWAWAIARARERDPKAIFVAEAYNGDPKKVEQGDILAALLRAGFDAVYDDDSYRTLKAVYDGPAWANDLDNLFAAQQADVFAAALRYGENHDEVRLAGRGHWGGVGMEVGRAVCGVLFGISCGPLLLYHGQEVGEPADGSEGFAEDNARTTIFDYWCMPEFAKWVNAHRFDGGRLSLQQRSLREFYGRLLAACAEPAFRGGAFFPLNSANIWNGNFGRVSGEHASGHWLYAFLRVPTEAPPFLVVVNLHRDAAFKDVCVLLTDAARAALDSLPEELLLTDRVGELAPLRMAKSELFTGGLTIPDLPPLAPCYFEMLPAD